MHASPDRDSRSRPWRVPFSLIAGFVCALLVALLASAPSLEHLRDTQAKVFLHSNLVLMDGKGRVDKRKFGVLTQGKPPVASIMLAADEEGFTDFSFVEFNIAGLHDADTLLFVWRSRRGDDEWRRTRVPVLAGKGLLRLDGLPGWDEGVSRAVLIIRTHEARWLEIGDIRFTAYTFASHIRALFSEWLDFEGWRTTSINRVFGGAPVQQFGLIKFAVVWLCLSIFVLWRLGPAPQGRARKPLPAYASLGVLVLCVWLVVDLRWQMDVFRQLTVTAAQVRRAQDDELIWQDVKYAFSRELTQVKAALPEEPHRIFLLVPGLSVENAYYIRFRTPYVLVPHQVYAWGDENLLRHNVRDGDYVLVYVAGDQNGVWRSYQELIAGEGCAERWTPVFAGNQMILAEIKACVD